MPSSTAKRPAPPPPPKTARPKRPPGLQKLEAQRVPPVTRVRAIKTGHNEYTVIEETFEGKPSSTKVLQQKTSGDGAMYWCRLRAEELLGPNRLGGTGLE